MLAPIGGLQPVGYLQLETDPITALAPLETELGMPIRIVAPSGQPAFQSRNWPGGISGEHTIYATHVQYTAGYEHGIDNYFRL